MKIHGKFSFFVFCKQVSLCRWGWSPTVALLLQSLKCWHYRHVPTERTCRLPLRKNPKVGKLNYINYGQERSKIETKANNRLVVPCGWRRAFINRKRHIKNLWGRQCFIYLFICYSDSGHKGCLIIIKYRHVCVLLWGYRIINKKLCILKIMPRGRLKLHWVPFSTVDFPDF